MLNIQKYIEQLGGRKLILSVLVFVINTVLLIATKLDEASYLSVIKLLVIAYSSGNVAQRLLVKSTNQRAEFIEQLMETVSDGQSLDALGGRKFLLIIGIYFTTVGLYLGGVLDALIYLDITGWTVGIYIASNVASKAVDNRVRAPLEAPDNIKT